MHPEFTKKSKSSFVGQSIFRVSETFDLPEESLKKDCSSETEPEGWARVNEKFRNFSSRNLAFGVILRSNTSSYCPLYPGTDGTPSMGLKTDERGERRDKGSDGCFRILSVLVCELRAPIKFTDKARVSSLTDSR
jgi:hypothetical protein